MDTAEVNWPYEIGTLAQLRQALADEKAAVDQGWKAVAATEVYKAWQARVMAKKQAEEEVRNYEDIIRLAALTQYKRTGEKKIGFGVSVRMNRKLAYGDDEALSYCKHGFTAALTFDRKVLDNMLFSMPANLLPAFVTLTEEPQATIATDLAKALRETPFENGASEA